MDPARSEGPGALTRANRDLIEELAQRGVVVSATQLKRWRNAHLIPSPVQQSAGRGRGRQSVSYPVGAVERTLAVARVMHGPPRVRITEVSLWLFAMGGDIDPAQLRADFGKEHMKYLKRVPTFGDEPSIDAFAENLVAHFSRHPLGKAVMRTAQLGAVRRASDAGKAAYSIVYQLFGERPTKSGMRAIARALGVTDRDLQDEIMGHVRHVRLHSIEKMLDEITDQELIEARDDCLAAVALIAQALPRDVVDRISAESQEMRRRFNFDAHTIMIGVIQMARMKRAYPNVSSRRFVEVLDEIRPSRQRGG